MKRALLILITFVAILQSCSKEETLDGKWVAEDINLKMEVSCECPEEEKTRIKELFNEGMQQEMERIKSSYYHIFKPDHTVISAQDGRERKGTYKLNGDEIVINYADSEKEEVTDIVREGEEIVLSSTIPEEELDNMTEIVEHPQYGDVKILFSHMNITLEETTE